VAPAESQTLLVSVVIPCLNEEENIEACVVAAREELNNAGFSG
jgi:glycosyltransferase involved in cell wall biosynthesis